jgi:predicted Zn-dependent protease with MMP-like domain
MNTPDLLQLQQWAENVVVKTIRTLPDDLRAHAEALPVTFEDLPPEDAAEDGIDPDTLGLFVGPELGDPEGAVLDVPSQVILYLENLWAFAEEDEDLFRGEVRTTYLHELGHYLGLTEAELEERGLL